MAKTKKGKPRKDQAPPPTNRPALDQVPLAPLPLGVCPFKRDGATLECSKRCALFSTSSPEDDTIVELRHAGFEYQGMCSLRMAGEALASMSRKHSNLTGF